MILNNDFVRRHLYGIPPNRARVEITFKDEKEINTLLKGCFIEGEGIHNKSWR